MTKAEREEMIIQTTRRKDEDAEKTEKETTIAKTEVTEIVLATIATTTTRNPHLDANGLAIATTTTRNPHLDETGLAIATTKEEIEITKNLRVDGIESMRNLRREEIEAGIEIIIVLQGDRK